jgi:hypothetical protein
VSRRRPGTCRMPGPGAVHCTEDSASHPYSCYDAGDDSSWNERQDWPYGHDCGDPDCPDIGYKPDGDR